MFLLGATPEVLALLVDRVTTRYPNLRVAGHRDGYFTEEQSADVAAVIRDSGADMLFLGMTSPKKEIFLASFGDTLGVPVLHGVGGSFDVLAGVTRGDVDIAVANLASMPKRADLMLLSQAYLRGPSMWIGRGTTEQSHNLRVATPADIRWEFVQAHKGERHWTPVPVKSWSEVDAALETLNLNGKLDALMASHLPFCIS